MKGGAVLLAAHCNLQILELPAADYEVGLEMPGLLMRSEHSTLHADPPRPLLIAIT